MTAEQSNPNDEASGWQRPEGCICPSTAGDGSDYYNPRDCPVHGVGPAPEVLSEPTPSGERWCEFHGQLFSRCQSLKPDRESCGTWPPGSAAAAAADAARRTTGDES